MTTTQTTQISRTLDTAEDMLAAPYQADVITHRAAYQAHFANEAEDFAPVPLQGDLATHRQAYEDYFGNEDRLQCRRCSQSLTPMQIEGSGPGVDLVCLNHGCCEPSVHLDADDPLTLEILREDTAA